MAIAPEALAAGGAELTPEVAGEYQRLTGAGAAAGRDTLERARANVAQRAAPRRPAEGRQAPAGAPRPTSRTGQRSGGAQRLPAAARTVYQALPAGQSGGSGLARTLARLIWAAAAGLIVLEIASRITGQTWSLSLPGRGPAPQPKPYQPLTGGAADLVPGMVPSSSPATQAALAAASQAQIAANLALPPAQRPRSSGPQVL